MQLCHGTDPQQYCQYVPYTRSLHNSIEQYFHTLFIYVNFIAWRRES